MKKIILLTEPTKILPAHTAYVGTLFEYAKDSHWMDLLPSFIPLETLIGCHKIAQDKASVLVEKFLKNEPFYRGIQQLKIFEEVILKECWKIHHVSHLHHFLISNNFTHCQFLHHSWWSQVLAQLNRLLQTGLTIMVPEKRRPGMLPRVMSRLYNNGFCWKAMKKEWYQLLDRIDKYHYYSQLRMQLANINYHQAWFYTTAHTYTNAGLLFEPYIPGKLNFLVENKETGGHPLIKANKKYYNLYSFGKRHFIPKKNEIKKVREELIHFVKNSTLTQNDKINLDLFTQLDWFRLFMQRLLPKGLYLSSLFESWVEKVKPSALFVGNPVYEGYSIYQAKKHSIPTILLQHGVVCENYSPGPVDYFIVKGEFWKNNVNQQFQQKVFILNPAYQ